MTGKLEELAAVVSGADGELEWKMVEIKEARCSRKRNLALTSQ
jgi:hypothetical protein